VRAGLCQPADGAQRTDAPYQRSQNSQFQTHPTLKAQWTAVFPSGYRADLRDEQKSLDPKNHRQADE
jgi:hypothetical protein